MGSGNLQGKIGKILRRGQGNSYIVIYADIPKKMKEKKIKKLFWKISGEIEVPEKTRGMTAEEVEGIIREKLMSYFPSGTIKAR